MMLFMSFSEVSCALYNVLSKDFLSQLHFDANSQYVVYE